MTWPATFQFLQDVATIGTAIGALATGVSAYFAMEQISVIRRQATTAFEDSLTEQYRNIMESIPINIWLGGDLLSGRNISLYRSFKRAGVPSP